MPPADQAASPGAPTGAVVGIDTGGTFTDITLLDPASGRFWTAKTPSTPDDPSVGFSRGVAEISRLSGLDGARIERVLHGTTVATNLILEAKGPITAMLVTEGFKYMLEIGRQDVPKGNSLFGWVKPKRPVRPQDIHEIAGRLDHEGAEIVPLDEAQLRAAARAIHAQGVRAVAIVFLNSYTNPAHEQEARRIILEEAPELLVSLSSEVVPVFREYERAMTTNLNAYVMAAVSRYVERLEERLEEQGVAAPLLLMKSSGGVASARIIRERPVETALSGPAAGIVGAAFVGKAAGFDNLIGIDIGGTSADISLIHGGEPRITATGTIGAWPIALPMVDLTTIGAGGGSIARVNGGMLAVGPDSAGAVPGPVCYGQGGSEPTITDAHLALGHIPAYLLDGSFELDVAGARQAIEQKIARPLGLSVEEAAQGILDIADNTMIGTIRVISVERGFDPREFVLVPYGGAGPMHSGAIARLMGIRTTLVAPAPGVLSAIGLLASNLKAEFARTCLQHSKRWDPAVIVANFGKPDAEAEGWFEAERVPAAARRKVRHLSMRYENQGFELSVPWAGELDAAGLAATVEAFHALHEQLYTFRQADTPVEITNIRVDAIGVFAQPSLAPAPASGSAADARTGTNRAHIEGAWLDVPVYDRGRLGVGATIAGPCIVTQLDSTLWMLPGQSGEVHPSGSIIVTDPLA